MHTKRPTYRLLRGFAALALALAAAATAAHAQTTPIYTATAANGGTLSVQSTQHYLQSITLNPANATSYTINTINLGINVADISQQYGFIMEIYTGVDLSATSGDALANAVYKGGVQGTLSIPTTAGSYNFTITPNTPISLPNNFSGTVGIDVYLTSADNTSYATGGLNGLFRVGGNGPTVGTNQTFVWSDADLDGTFTGAEQTQFGNATRAQIYLGLTGSVAAVPEPATTGLCLLGAAGCVLAVRRKSKRAA